MKKNILITGLLILSYLFVAAQEKPQQNDLDKEYTPPPTSFFNNNSKDNINSHSFDVTQNKNIITFSIVSLIRGYSELSYERAINTRFSMAVGYGIYFMPDNLYTFCSYAMDAVSDGDWEYSPLRDAIVSSEFIAKKSHHFSFEAKLYLNKTDFESRNFLRFNTKFMNLHYIYDFKDQTDNSKIVFPEFQLDSKVFSLDYGIQWNTGNEKVKFSNEMFVGMGVRNNKFFNYRAIVSNSNTIGYLKDTEKTSEMKLSLNFGYKMGIGW